MKKILSIFLIILCLAGAFGVSEGKIEAFLLFGVAFAALCLINKIDKK